VIAHKVTRPTQSAFIPGRNILEGVVIPHETIHEFYGKKMDGVLFKIDFEKLMIKSNGIFFCITRMHIAIHRSQANQKGKIYIVASNCKSPMVKVGDQSRRFCDHPSRKKLSLDVAIHK
jgi:hypothetical protein